MVATLRNAALITVDVFVLRNCLFFGVVELSAVGLRRQGGSVLMTGHAALGMPHFVEQ